jgi:hypothetical protein
MSSRVSVHVTYNIMWMYTGTITVFEKYSDNQNFQEQRQTSLQYRCGSAFSVSASTIRVTHLPALLILFTLLLASLIPSHNHEQ